MNGRFRNVIRPRCQYRVRIAGGFRDPHGTRPPPDAAPRTRPRSSRRGRRRALTTLGRGGPRSSSFKLVWTRPLLPFASVHATISRPTSSIRLDASIARIIFPEAEGVNHTVRSRGSASLALESISFSGTAGPASFNKLRSGYWWRK